MGLEGMTKGIWAGVARCVGHFAYAVSWIAEQRLGLGEPNFLQELVEGHARCLTEQGGEIRGIHLHGQGHVGQADRAEVMLMHVVEHRVNKVPGVALQARLDRGFRKAGQPMVQFLAQARDLGLSVVQPAHGFFQSAPGQPSLGGGFQIVEDQTRQSHSVMEGGGGNRFQARLVSTL